MEAAELGIFMLSACVFVVLLEHPASPAPAALPVPFVRRALVGIAMGLTAIGIVYSPLGKRSGAHFNPSVTLTFLRLGKIAPWDALFYVAAQFAGGVAGVALAAVVLPRVEVGPIGGRIGHETHDLAEEAFVLGRLRVGHGGRWGGCLYEVSRRTSFASARGAAAPRATASRSGAPAAGPGRWVRPSRRSSHSRRPRCATAIG